MIRMLIHRAVLVGLSAWVCWWVMKRYGIAPTLIGWAVGWGVICAVGAMLLRMSEVGKIGWKNRVVGYALSWGYMIARGRLWAIGLTSWAVWVLIAVGVALQMGRAHIASTDARMISTEPSVLLFIAWAIDAAALLYVVGVLMKNFSFSSTGGRSLIKMMVILSAILCGSVALLLAGHPNKALLLAGGPPLALGGGYGLFLGMMLTFGRNARWN